MPVILPTKPSSHFDDCFQRTCRDRAASLAVLNLADSRSLTFSALFDQYTAFGTLFHEARIGAGTTIVTRVGNHAAFFALFAASMTAGAALVALGEATDDEAASVVAAAGAAAVITERPLPIPAASARAIGGGLQLLRLAATRQVNYGESVVLKLTSGSTDVPKAAIAGVHHLVNDGRHVIAAMGLAPDDINLAYIPLSHSYAIGNLVMPLLLQGTAVALRQSFHPRQLLDDAAATEATAFPGVPFMFQGIRELDVDHLPPRLRLLITAGARIDPATVRWFHDRLGRKVHSFYGSSETGGISYDDGDDLAETLHLGRAMPETTIEIRDPDATGIGRIVVSGTAVASGYAGALDAARARLEESDGESGFVDGPSTPLRAGRFITTDLGYVGSDGCLVMTGRRSPLVNVAGRKVDPAEVERVLVDLPGVLDARVIGAACDRRGQQLVAFVVSASDRNSIALRQQCARLLSPHKIPRRFIFLDRLPVDARGKMDRRALEALAIAEPGTGGVRL